MGRSVGRRQTMFPVYRDNDVSGSSPESARCTSALGGFVSDAPAMGIGHRARFYRVEAVVLTKASVLKRTRQDHRCDGRGAARLGAFSLRHGRGDEH